MLELVVRKWRITRGIPGGCHCWFDPTSEGIRLYRLPHLVGEGVSAESSEVAVGGGDGYLDKVGSVSAYEPSPGEYDQDRFEQFSLLEEETELP